MWFSHQFSISIIGNIFPLYAIWIRQTCFLVDDLFVTIEFAHLKGTLLNDAKGVAKLLPWPWFSDESWTTVYYMDGCIRRRHDSFWSYRRFLFYLRFTLVIMSFYGYHLTIHPNKIILGHPFNFIRANLIYNFVV